MATATEILFVDLSDNQPFPYDFPSLRQDGIDGVMLKVSEGVHYRNELLDLAWADAKAAGMVVGGYHFARPYLNSALAEAQYFVSCFPKLVPGDMAVLDIEDGANYGPELGNWSLEFVQEAALLLGFKPLVYASMDYVTHYLINPKLSAYGLWLAQPGVAPENRATKAGVWDIVAMTQVSWTQRYNAISNGNSDVDLNVFHGNYVQLKAYGKPEPRPVYPYTTQAKVKGTLKAAGHPDQKWPGQPSHSSSAALDPIRNPATVGVGDPLIVTGPVVHTDDAWVPCRFPTPSPIHGWYPKASLVKPPLG